MRFIFYVLIFFFALESNGQSTERTVEVSGHASKKFLADKYYMMVTVKGSGQCEIPPGKHYQKYIKECRENNKKVLASREDILKGILTYFDTRIKKIETNDQEVWPEAIATEPAAVPADYDVSSFLTKNYLLEFGVYADVIEFLTILKDYKGMIDGGKLSALCTKLKPADFDEIKLASLKDAQQKAEQMAKTLNAQLGPVKNIYEEKPEDANSLSNYFKGMSGIDSYSPDYLPNSITSRSLYNDWDLPDDQGYLTFSKSTFVRFLLK